MSSIKHALDGFVFSTIFYEGRPIPLNRCVSIEEYRIKSHDAQDIDIERLEVSGNYFDPRPIRKLLLDEGSTEVENGVSFRYGYLLKPEISTVQLVGPDETHKRAYVFPLKARKIKVRLDQQ